jgi:hypothetical protein
MSKRGELVPIGDLIKASGLKAPTPIESRILDAAAAEQEEAYPLYQHTVLCQTCLPYRDPGDEVRVWDRIQGGAHLRIKAGEAMHPKLGRLVDVGLPFGPKSRVILMHINQLAILTQSPVINVGDSFTSFIRTILDLAPNGQNLRIVKDQLARLSTAEIVLGQVREGKQALTEATRIVSQLEVWLTKDENQRILWPERINLSRDYFESLIEHAVPLDEKHIQALSHTCMGLDIYQWLAQRLHRIKPGQPQKLSWLALWGQFGQGYDLIKNPKNMGKFRMDFRKAMRQVLALYQQARVEDDEQKKPRIRKRGGELVWRSDYSEGLTLHHSQPPVLKRPPKGTTTL